MPADEPTTGPKVDAGELLPGMYRDGYFPNGLVDRVRDVLLDCCREIEAERPADLPALCAITDRATGRINDLQDDFEDAGSEIETAAREEICAAFGLIAETYGFPDADPEDLAGDRDW